MVRSKQTKAQQPDQTLDGTQLLPIPDHLWDMDEVCAFLRVGKDKVRWLIEKRELPHSRWGDVIRFYPARVARWAEQEQQTISA